MEKGNQTNFFRHKVIWKQPPAFRQLARLADVNGMGGSSARAGSGGLFAQQESGEVKLAAFRECIQELPDVESPEIFGLHPNADLNFRMKESREVLETALDIQPKESSSALQHCKWCPTTHRQMRANVNARPCKSGFNIF